MEKTWWRVRADSYAERVRGGEFGVVKAEWEDGDGWDSVHKFPHFAVKVAGGKIVHLHVNESGVWLPTPGGGHENISVDALRNAAI